MDSYRQDLRYACRTLLRSPVVTLVALICIGLGVGVSTTTFSMVDGILFQSLPFEDPDNLVNLGTRPTRNEGSAAPLLDSIDLLDLAEMIATAHLDDGGDRGNPKNGWAWYAGI